MGMGWWALLLGVVGAAFNLVAAVWLVMGSNPESERYTDDGELYPGRQVSRVVPNLVRDQRKIAALVVIGSTLLLAAAGLAFASN